MMIGDAEERETEQNRERPLRVDEPDLAPGPPAYNSDSWMGWYEPHPQYLPQGAVVIDSFSQLTTLSSLTCHSPNLVGIDRCPHGHACAL